MLHAPRQLPSWLIFDVRQKRTPVIFYTGWVTMVTLIGAALSLWLAHDMPALLKGSSPSSIAALRWSLAIAVSIAIFVVGWITNRKKVTRMGPSGKAVEGAPNTVFFVPLQYWAFVYSFMLTCAIMVWQTQEP
jgi:hypothetical protein